MSSRNGRYLAALGGLITGVLLSGPTSAQAQQQQAQRPSHDQRLAAPAHPAPPTQASPAVKVISKNGKAEPPQHESQGPRWVAPFRFFDKHNGSFNAIAAVAVAIFTYFLWKLGERQTDILEQNAAETRDSIAIAREAAAAATKSANASERALTHAERAFVYPKGWAMTGWTNPLTREFNGLGAALMWENSGNTPTKRMLTHFNYELRDTELPPDFDFPDVPNFTPAVSLIGPKVVITSEQINLPPAELRLIQSGRMRFYVWGWAEYDDIFPGTPRHRTEFCHELTIPGDLDHPDGGTFIMRTYKRHNGSDEDCENTLRT